MKMRSMVSLIVLGAGMPALAADASLAGKWKYVSDVGGVHRQRECAFEQKDRTFTGICKNDDGNVVASGTVAGDEVTLTYEVDLIGQKVPFVCTGKLVDGALAGTLSSPASEGLSGTCSLVRS